MRAGREPPPPADELSRLFFALFTTMAADPDLFRAALEYVGTITPIQEIFRRPDVAERGGSPPIEMPGPGREELPDLLR